MSLWRLALAAGIFCLALPARAEYTRNVAIVIWNGAEVLDWAGPSEVFESAGRFGTIDGEEAFEVYTVSKTTDPIVSQRFVRVIPQYSIHEAPKPDIVVLPGGGTGSVLRDPEFLAWAGEAARGAEIAMSVCTGAFVLGKAGLLDGKAVTTWYGATDGLEREFPEATVHRGRRFVDNGQVLTTAGVSAGIDGALHAVARLLGRDVADRTAQYMEYKWAPEAYLAQNYGVLNPHLDARGRALQQADIDLRAKNYAPAVAAFEAIVAESPEDLKTWYQLGSARFGRGNFVAAAEAFSKASADESVRGRAYYNAACAYARAGQENQALDALALALENGMTDVAHVRGDEDLAGLRETARFKALVGDPQ